MLVVRLGVGRAACVPHDGDAGASGAGVPALSWGCVCTRPGVTVSCCRGYTGLQMGRCHRACVVPSRSGEAGWVPHGMGCPVEGLRAKGCFFMALLTALPLTLPGFVNANSSPIWLVMIMRFSSDYRKNKGKQPFFWGGVAFCIIISIFPPKKEEFPCAPRAVRSCPAGCPGQG